MSCVQGSPVKSIPILEKCTAAEVSTAGRTRFASLVRFGRKSFGWRTCQLFFKDIGVESLGTWPCWGMMQGGECYPLAPLVSHIHVKDCSAWRTPAASDWKRRNLDWPSVRKAGNPLCLPQQLAQLGYHGFINPAFLEYLMDWPDTWAELKPLEMGKFQAWCDSHGKPCPVKALSPSSNLPFPQRNGTNPSVPDSIHFAVSPAEPST